MDPQQQFCRNVGCWAYGRSGEGHVVIHSRAEQRYRCKRCRRTFAATAGTALYRLRTAHTLVVSVLTLLAHGCPAQAIVAAFGLDERTVARWQARAGAHRRRVHEHLVQGGRAELAQVQADELRARAVGGVLWLASALSAPRATGRRSGRCSSGCEPAARSGRLCCAPMGWPATPSRPSGCSARPGGPGGAAARASSCRPACWWPRRSSGT